MCDVIRIVEDLWKLKRFYSGGISSAWKKKNENTRWKKRLVALGYIYTYIHAGTRAVYRHITERSRCTTTGRDSQKLIEWFAVPALTSKSSSTRGDENPTPRPTSFYSFFLESQVDSGCERELYTSIYVQYTHQEKICTLPSFLFYSFFFLYIPDTLFFLSYKFNSVRCVYIN